jgi:hypothetical protein
MMTGRTPRILAAVALATAIAPAPAIAFTDAELDQEALSSSVLFDLEVFDEPGKPVPLDSVAPISGNCVLDPSEQCVGGPGIRKLLRFDVQVHNRGDEDIVLGNPREHPDLFIYSACHGHYHFAQASLYELLDASGGVVATGRKQGFCLEDTNPSSPATTWPRRYNCDLQGIQVGWSDVYAAELDCQWIDVTDLPPGEYSLHVLWNPQGLIPETTMENNESFVPVTIEANDDPAPVVARVSHPNGSSTVQAGRAVRIAWSASDDGAIVSQEVWASRDDGETWEQLAGNLPGTARSFLWSVPLSAATERARIRVVARDASADKGEAVSARFRIKRGARRLAVRPGS